MERLSYYKSVMGESFMDVTPTPGDTVRVLAFDTAALGVPCTMVTSGMSDRPMAVPPGTSEFSRAELIWYTRSSSRQYAVMLCWLAEFPFIDSTWIGHGHTVRWYEPLFEGSALHHYWIIPPLVRQHRGMAEKVRIGGDPVHLWWVVPITQAELDLKIREGSEALLDVFDRCRHPLVLDESRKSYV